MLRKSPASNAWAAIFLKADFPGALRKLQNWENFAFWKKIVSF